LNKTTDTPATDEEALVPGNRRCGRTTTAIVGGLLIVHLFLALGSMAGKSATYDEVFHVTRGYVSWHTGDMRLTAGTMPLPSLWMAMPLYDVPVEYPSFDDPTWYDSNPWVYSLKFFFGSGNDTPRMLERARTLIAIVSVGLGLAVFLWSRALFGVPGGILSLTMYAFSPTMLAHARLGTTDLMTAAFFTLSIASVWAAMNKLTWLRALGSAVALAGLFLCKLTAILVVPMLALLALICVFHNRPLPVMISARRHWSADSVRARLLAVAVLLAIQSTVIYAGVWCAYGMRYHTFVYKVTGNEKLTETHQPDSSVDRWELQYGDRHTLKEIVEFCRRHKLFPEMYLYTIAMGTQTTAQREAFIDGEHSMTGFRRFFPLAFLYKTPLPVLGLLAAALAALLMSRRWRRLTGAGAAPAISLRARFGKALYATLPIWVLLVVYWYFAINASINIGHRHILATYPPLFVLCGAAAGLFSARQRLVRWLVPVLAGLLVVCSLRIFPHYLAYFNSLAGGPGNGYRHLVDSSLDWGQDIDNLRIWLDRNRGTEAVYFSWFGNGPPRYYGIDAHALPFETLGYAGYRSIGTGSLTPGIYCISATMLQQVYFPGLRAWTPELEDEYRKMLPEMGAFEEVPPGDTAGLREQLASRSPMFARRFARFQRLRFAKLCAWLRDRDCEDHVGYSILIYRLDAEDLEQALR
jgi:4-amino-4-deoxy-L-arabinose transferase-like glycosyltransferase